MENFKCYCFIFDVFFFFFSLSLLFEVSIVNLYLWTKEVFIRYASLCISAFYCFLTSPFKKRIFAQYMYIINTMSIYKLNSV